jgi:hypothetical protein
MRGPTERSRSASSACRESGRAAPARIPGQRHAAASGVRTLVGPIDGHNSSPPGEHVVLGLAGQEPLELGRGAGRAQPLGSTRCHACGGLLIERDWYRLGAWNLTGDGGCTSWGTAIPGVFAARPGTWGARALPIATGPA